MTANNDITEIMTFIDKSDLLGKNCELDICLDRITENIDEEYLLLRARTIKAHLDDPAFINSIARLATICNKKLQNCNCCPINKYCNHFIKEARKARTTDRLTMVDMFCGAGGLSLGFKQEGFVTILANDIESCCVDTYAHNHPETPRDHIIKGDIRDVVSNLEELLGDTYPSIVVGGPPCQGFSEANRQRLIDDPRNHLYKSFIEVVDKAKPTFFVMENVKGMLKVKNQVIEDFQQIGFSVTARVLNAKDYGVPQNRERLIYIGNRIGINNDIIFDEIESQSINIQSFTLEDALFGLRPLQASRIKNATEIDSEESGCKIDRTRSLETNNYIKLINSGNTYPFVLNHKARYNNDRDIMIFDTMLPGDKSDDPKIADIMPYRNRNNIFKDKYYKLEFNKVCKTITAHMKFDCNMYIHPEQARGLTPREAARVQSYPDDYFFRGPYTKTYMQIGNSVPPLLGRAIAHVIKKYINDEKVN